MSCYSYTLSNPYYPGLITKNSKLRFVNALPSHTSLNIALNGKEVLFDMRYTDISSYIYLSLNSDKNENERKESRDTKERKERKESRDTKERKERKERRETVIDIIDKNKKEIIVSTSYSFKPEKEYTIVIHGSPSVNGERSILILLDNNICPSYLRSHIRVVNVIHILKVEGVYFDDTKLFSNIEYDSVGSPGKAYKSIESEAYNVSFDLGSFKIQNDPSSYLVFEDQKTYTLFFVGSSRKEYPPKMLFSIDNSGLCYKMN
jgi:hypothetical protein